MRRSRTPVALTVLCFLLGILLVSQFRTQERVTAELRAQSPQNQLTLLGNLITGNARLRDEVSKLEVQLRSIESDSTPDLGVMIDETEELRSVNGLVEARGQGVRLTLDAGLEPYWLQDVLNELRNAGATGLAINGKRVLATSVVEGAARDLRLNGQPLQRPYVIEALGDQDTLATALGRPGGLLLQLRAQYGTAVATLARQPELHLTAHASGPTMRLAQPAP
ncbi:MAG: DUF881 domain-containing protein [Chloroflexi bacterium]|nr:DUF881 domain-containing protein [Chloroflexota bacterium]